MRYIEGARGGKAKRPVAPARVNEQNLALRPNTARILFTPPRSSCVASISDRPFGTSSAGALLAGFGVRLSDTALGLGLNESRVCIALREAHRLLRQGWVEDVPWCDDEGRYPTDNATHFSLQGALRSGVDDPLASDYAIRLVRRIIGEHDLHRWARNPVRKHSEVLRAVELAIEAAGGVAPRRGGWQVHSGSIRAPQQLAARRVRR